MGPAPDIHKLTPIGKRLSLLLNSLNRQKGSLSIVVAYVDDTFRHSLGDSLHKFAKVGGKTQVVVGIDSRGTARSALEWLLKVLPLGDLHVYHNPADATFHPKFFIVKDGSKAHVLIGSSNLTGGGMANNFEINIEVELDLGDSKDKAFLSEFENLVQKTISCPSCVKLDAAMLLRIDAAGALKKRSSTRGEAIITRKASKSLSSLFGKTRHARLTPRQKAIKMQARSQKSKFVMSLVHNDLSVPKRADPYFLIPLAARDQEPGFWGWPTKFTKTKKGIPERRFNVTIHLLGKTVTEKSRLSYYAGYREFRFKSKSIYNLGSSYIGSYVVISWSRDSSGSRIANVELVPRGTPKYTKLGRLKFQKVGSRGKRFTYT